MGAPLIPMTYAICETSHYFLSSYVPHDHSFPGNSFSSSCTSGFPHPDGSVHYPLPPNRSDSTNTDKILNTT